ncbi:hypothetical protein C8J55DRAFT_556000 [Lentinula edodes]|uniref:Uncharacterized protein n=1 Tax=Lentinula lateritia TaxID=40482 RepID=A0A9W9AXX6_9AGAR|nr:hypothetical protein C8J55DRAFT_556000 [Lentinula edodes]
MSSPMSSSPTTPSPIHLSSPDNKALQVSFVDRRDAHHDLWASEQIQAEYRDWPHDSESKDQRFEGLTERIQSQCNYLASVFSSERRVYGIKAAYYGGSPIALIVIEDSDKPLPVVSEEQMFFPVHVFHGVFRWTCDASSTKPPTPPNNHAPAGTLITLLPPTIAPEFIPPTTFPESTIFSSTSPRPSCTFTAGAFLRDKHDPSQCFILSVGHPMSSGRSSLSITEEQPTLKIGWPAISPRVERMQSHLRRLGAYTYSNKIEAAFCYAQITELERSPDQVLDEIEQRKLDRIKQRYKSLQQSLLVADMQHKRVSDEIEKYVGLALGDTAIGHIRTAFHGYADRDLPTTPNVNTLDNKRSIHSSDTPFPSSITDANLVDVSLIKITDPSFIPKNTCIQLFELIQELRPGQEVSMHCNAVSQEQSGEVGLLKAYFGLPDFNPNPNPLVLGATDENEKQKLREAQHFVQEYAVSEPGFTAAGSSGAIVYTDGFAAVGMAVGHFISLIPMCIVLPLDRLVRSVERAAGVELEFVPPIFEEDLNY